jgi:hypothetical protein
MSTPTVSYGGECRGCRGALALVDRETKTYKCEVCHCEFQIGSTTEMIPNDGTQPRPPAECECGALLIPAFDSGPECRNCVKLRA